MLLNKMRRTLPEIDYTLLLVIIIALIAAWPFMLHPSLPRETDTELHVFRSAE